MADQAPAGWYPDGRGYERYWEGSSWTEDIRTPNAPDATAGADKVEGGAFSRLGAAVKKAAADRQSAKEDSARQWAADAHAAGLLVTSGVFGTSTIEIYEGGYVRVAEGKEDLMEPAKISKKTSYEKLRTIKFTASDADAAAASAPSALEGVVGTAMTSLFKGGRALAKGSVPGLAAAGIAHIATTGSRRAFLTIATDKAIHTLTNQSTNSVGIKTTNKGYNEVGRALEAAGNAVLGTSDAPAPALAPAVLPVVSAQVSAGPTLADRLRELAGLHAEGVLSDEEFAASKARLLGLLHG